MSTPGNHQQNISMRKRRNTNCSKGKRQDKERSRSRSRQRKATGTSRKEVLQKKPGARFQRSSSEHGKGANNGEASTSSCSKNRLRSSSRDKEHSRRYRSSPKSNNRHYGAVRRPPRNSSCNRFKYRKPSRLPPPRRDTRYGSDSRKLPERNSPRKNRSPRRCRSPLGGHKYGDQDHKYKNYRKRSRSYCRDSVKASNRNEDWDRNRTSREARNQNDQRRPIPSPFAVPSHYATSWPVYEPVPRYTPIMVSESGTHPRTSRYGFYHRDMQSRLEHYQYTTTERCQR